MRQSSCQSAARKLSFFVSWHLAWPCSSCLLPSLFFRWPTEQTDHDGWYRARVRILVRCAVEGGVSCDCVLCLVMCPSIVRCVRCGAGGAMISSDLSAQHVPHSTPFLSVASNRQSIDFSSIHIYSRSDWCTIESDPGVFVSFMLSGTSPATSFILLICPICHALDVPLSPSLWSIFCIRIHLIDVPFLLSRCVDFQFSPSCTSPIYFISQLPANK